MPSTSKKQARLMAAVAHNPAFAKKVGIPVSVGKEFNKADTGKKFKEGGMAKKLFGGKETYSEELKEAKALKSGKISPRGFAKGEKSEGHKEENSMALAKKIKSGKMSPSAYAKMESAEYCGGGKVRKMAAGGAVDPRAALMAKKRAMLGNMGATAPAQLQGRPTMGRPVAPTAAPAPTVPMKKGGVAKTVTKEMEYDYKTGKKSFAGTTAQRDRHAEKEGKIVAKHAAYDKAMGMKSGGRIASKGEHSVQKKSKRGAEIIKMAKGGLAMGHKSADGIAVRGKTRGLQPSMAAGGKVKRYC